MFYSSHFQTVQCNVFLSIGLTPSELQTSQPVVLLKLFSTRKVPKEAVSTNSDLDTLMEPDVKHSLCSVLYQGTKAVLCVPK